MKRDSRNENEISDTRPRPRPLERIISETETETRYFQVSVSFGEIAALVRRHMNKGTQSTETHQRLHYIPIW